MEAIMAIAKEHLIRNRGQRTRLVLIVFLLESKKAGTIGHVGSTSFFPSKNLGCDGGAIFTNDDALAHKTAES
jgi:dTDP-4-amino-4,6-dideoxygalactose transaminase